MGGDRKETTAFKVMLEQKRQVQREVRQRFARYGDEVCLKIEEAAVRPHGLQRMMESFGIPSHPDFKKQLERLARFLHDKGAQRFLYHLAQRETRPDFTTPVPGMLKDSPEKSIPDEQPLFDENGRYIGPERRKKQERRQSQDRRSKSKTVRENRRFGREQRRYRRRKEDRRP